MPWGEFLAARRNLILYCIDRKGMSFAQATAQCNLQDPAHTQRIYEANALKWPHPPEPDVPPFTLTL